MSKESSDGSSGQSRTPLASLIKAILVIILLVGVLFGIKMYYRDPALRHYDLCYYPYLIARTAAVDIPKEILISDPSTILNNSNHVTRFFYSCLDTTKKWRFLKKF
jgi:hypothetical protein